MKRRDFVLALGAAAVAAGLPVRAAVEGERTPLRIGLTPVFLDDQAAFLNRLRDYLAAKTRLPVVFAQRSTYREILEQVRARALDIAWLCGYPYVMEPDRLRLMAVPLYLGRPDYRSYLIVRAELTGVDGMEDLAGTVFAFSDPNSFSGSLYPRYLLHRAGLGADRFFRRTFYTWSHRKVVEAVSVGLADAGAVAGYVWDTLQRLHPEFTGNTRVAARSPAYGFPPIVARADLDSERFAIMQSVLLDMRADRDGARLLENLNLDGFVPGEPAMYDEIRRIAPHVDQV